jgi:hypothetical protein
VVDTPLGSRPPLKNQSGEMYCARRAAASFPPRTGVFKRISLLWKRLRPIREEASTSENDFGGRGRLSVAS